MSEYFPKLYSREVIISKSLTKVLVYNLRIFKRTPYNCFDIRTGAPINKPIYQVELEALTYLRFFPWFRKLTSIIRNYSNKYYINEAQENGLKLKINKNKLIQILNLSKKIAFNLMLNTPKRLQHIHGNTVKVLTLKEIKEIKALFESEKQFYGKFPKYLKFCYKLKENLNNFILTHNFPDKSLIERFLIYIR